MKYDLIAFDILIGCTLSNLVEEWMILGCVKSG